MGVMGDVLIVSLIHSPTHTFRHVKVWFSHFKVHNVNTFTAHLTSLFQHIHHKEGCHFIYCFIHNCYVTLCQSIILTPPLSAELTSDA